MTDTTTKLVSPATAAAQAPETRTAIAINDAVATAKNLPDLIQKAHDIDPSLAAAISGKALIASKTPWGTLLAAGVSYLAAKKGLGWDEATCELVAGAGVLVGAYLMRWISPERITGFFTKKPVDVTASTVAPPQGSKP